MMTDLVFIQMSGAPGSGKTTIATAIAKEIGAVVIDHDVTKTALLDADVPIGISGRASYEVLGAIAQHLLNQGHSVIHDSPCAYEVLLERGQRVAEEVGAAYRYIECVVSDVNELDRRLRTRISLRSQRRGVAVSPIDIAEETRPREDIFWDWLANMKRPTSNYLTLDTSRPRSVCVKEAIAYITL